MSGVSTATVIAGVGAAASVASAASSMMRGGGAQQQGNAAAVIGERNAQIAEQNAMTAKQKAAADAGDIAIMTRKALGSQRVAAGAGGLVDEGSPLEGIMESAANGELNRQRRLWQGDMEARDFTIQAESDRMAGQMGLMTAGNQAIGNYADAGASLMTGLSRLAGMFKFSGGPKVDPRDVFSAGSPDAGY